MSITAYRAEVRAARLTAAVRAMVIAVRDVPDEVLARDPADGWSAKRVLAHVGEMLPYWSREVDRVVGADRDGAPFGRTHDDADRIAAVEDGADADASTLVACVEVGLGIARGAINAVPPHGWLRTGRHARRGVMTVEEIVDAFLVGHAEEHLVQIRSAVADGG